MKRSKLMAEGAKPQMIDDIEKAFGLGERTWDSGANFSPNRIHMISMFDIINKYIFESKLDRSEPKEIVDPVKRPEYRNALASFSVGQVKGAPHSIQLVRHPRMTNFYITFTAMIHEMIHFYDFAFGPLGKMINECVAVGHLNWGQEYGSPSACLRDAGFSYKQNPMDPNSPKASTGLELSQLPDDMPNGVRMAKQYQFPAFVNKQAADVALHSIANPRVSPQLRGAFLKNRTLYPKKYELSEISMYDVHGAYFKRLAERAKYMGFDVSETFDPSVPHRMKKTWESEGVGNVVELIESKLETNQYIGSKYIDGQNWFVEIQ